MMSRSNLKTLLALATALTATPLLADHHEPEASQPTLEEQFQDPPNSARPRVWWHWMNGNVTKDGIAKDLAWMKRVGIGGLQNFDANLQTPQIVEKRLVYMTPEWKDAFRFAASEANRLGLELAIAASPGWSETGGPWVLPEDGLKKLVWSETEITGGKPFAGKLAAPPSVTGPFQTVAKAGFASALSGPSEAQAIPTHYSDVAVLAFPLRSGSSLAPPVVSLADGTPVDAAMLSDSDLQSAIELSPGTAENPASLTITYPKPETIRTASLFLPGASMLFFGAAVKPRLEASEDGKTWRAVADITAMQVPTTVSFAPVTAKHFRMVFAPIERPLPFNSMSPGVDLAGLGAMMGDAGAAAMAGGGNLKVGDLRLSGEPRIDHYEAKAGFEVERDYYSLSRGLEEADGVDPAKVIDLTGRMKADGTLDWTPPAGRWRVLRLGASLLGTTNHPAPPEATGLEVDKFDAPAVRRYLEHYIGMYRDAAGAVGDKGVDALLTDSIEVGAANWTPKMIEQFKRLRSYDPVPWMPALTGTIVKSRADSDKFLYDYRRTLADLIASEHYGTVAEVAHENGLTVYGEALENMRPSLGDDMAMRRHADVPMSAMWTHPREAGPTLSHLADMKGASSVAHIYGQNLAAAESLTSSMSYWDHAPAYLKRIIDLEFVHGINRPVIHTSVHQPLDDKVPGLTLFIFGQYFNRHESWAELAKPWVDYISRNAFLLQQGRNVADVGYFYGEEQPLTALYEMAPIADAPMQNAWDFVNFDALTGALANDGDELVTPGGARYKALYLGGSSRLMTVAALKRLAELVEGGATVIGKAPEATPSLSDDPAEFAALVKKLWPGTDMARIGKGRVIAHNDVEAGLRAIGVAPDFRFTGAGEGAKIPFVHRKLADGDSYFLVNQLDRTETIEAHFRVVGKAPRLWRAETGTSEPLSYRIENGETIVPLTLRADESVHVLFRQQAKADTLTVGTPEPVELANLDGSWNVAFQQGRGAPESIVMDSLIPLDEHAEVGVKYFSGIATYSTSFTAPRGWKPGEKLLVDLGEAREVAEVLVNGQHAGYAWHAPYTVDIGKLAKKGANTLEVRVANLWVNRLIGDAQEGAEKVAWTPMPAYTADAPLRRSGLIGPVRLLGEGD
jgi:hypothetical protein